MPVTVRPIGHLKSLTGGRSELIVPAGISVRQALELLQIQPELVALVVINGVHQANKDTVLNEGDVVKLMTVVGGG